jgi:hypothetical protein
MLSSSVPFAAVTVDLADRNNIRYRRNEVSRVLLSLSLLLLLPPSTVEDVVVEVDDDKNRLCCMLYVVGDDDNDDDDEEGIDCTE